MRISLDKIIRNPAARSGRWTAFLLLSGLLALAGAGCKSADPLETAGVTAPKGSQASRLSVVELREKLAGFYTVFVNTIEKVTSDAAMQTNDPDMRQKLLEARIRAARSCRQTVFQRQPMAAFLDTWNLCLQFEIFLSSPEGRERFGAAQPAMVTAATGLRRALENLGTLFLKPEELAKVKAQLTEFAREHPMSLGSENVSLPSMAEKAGIPQFGWLIELPLSPFRAFQGVDQTAAAVHEVAMAADSISQTAGDLPRMLSWQSELLMVYAQRQVEDMMFELDRKQTNTQATLLLVRSTINDTERTLKAATETSQAIDATLKTYTQMMKDLYPPSPPPAVPPPNPGRPFDILDYAHTADQLTVTVTNLQRLLVEVQNTVDTNAISQRVKEVQASVQTAVTDTQASARQLSTHIALLAILVIVVFFVGLTLYRIVSSRTQRKSAVNPN